MVPMSPHIGRVSADAGISLLTEDDSGIRTTAGAEEIYETP